jgi:formylglycine-generating enzyme required for sulfatase activity
MAVVLLSLVFLATAAAQLPATQAAPNPRLQAFALVRKTTAIAQQNHDLAQARQGYEKAAEIDPTYSMPWLWLGSIAQEQREYQKAIQCFDHYLELDSASDYAMEAASRRNRVVKILAAKEEEKRMREAYAAFMAQQMTPDPTLPTSINQPWSNSVGIKLGYIPAGQFDMGSRMSPAEIAKAYGGNEAWFKDSQLHHVTITRAFFIGVTPVTQAQWRQVMGDNPSVSQQNPQSADMPVERVSWEDAMHFCQALSLKEKRKYRLPTEAEWEYACRAGSTTEFCFGDNPADLPAYAWHNANSKDVIHLVGQLKPNAWGLYDMSGNVWQWCSDSYAPYEKGDAVDPKGAAEGTDRVMRGGAFTFPALHCRSAYRMYGRQDNDAEIYSFRIVMQME